MNLRLTAIVPWMVLAGAAYGQIRSAEVLYTFHEATPSPAYRVGDECFVTLDTAEQWGWKVKQNGSDADVEAEGHAFHLGMRTLADRSTIPITKAIHDIGGQSEWSPDTDTLSVFSTLKEVTVSQDGVGTASIPTLHASAALPFKIFPFYLNPSKAVVDLDGVRIATATKQTLPAGARMFQYRTNVVRVILDAGYVPKLPMGLPEATSFDLPITRDPDQPNLNAQPTTQPVVPPTPPITNPSLTPSVPISVSVDSDTANSTTIGFHIPAFAGEATVLKTDPETLQLTLPGVSSPVASGLKADTTAIESIQARSSPAGTVLTIKLPRPMGAEVTSGAGGVTLSLLKPNVGDGRLAGKTIVVDPGHGGHDRGAHEGSLNEKDLTLAIGKKLAAKLAQAGATVIMTRQTDVFIPLLTRTHIANENHADFFVSCHINSTGGDGLQSGTITFHHLGNKIGYLLAECIQHEIAKVNRLPNLGAWSDGKIYQTGFSVLRHADMPAVLIEFGFINHPRDRARIVTEEFQESVTDAVVKGIRVFLGETKPNG